jgi:hypothetical protein
VNATTSPNSQWLLHKRSGCVDDGWSVVLLPSGVVAVSVAGGGANFPATNGQSLRDGQWHSVQFMRVSLNNFELVVDAELVLSHHVDPNVDSLGTMTFGGADCYPAMSYFIGDIANVTVFVDLLPGSICTRLLRAIAVCRMQSSSRFCSPHVNGSQCCAVNGCSQCAAYHSCSQSFDFETKSPTSTSFLPSSSSFSLESLMTLSTTIASTTTVVTITTTALTRATISMILIAKSGESSVLIYVIIAIAIVAVVAVGISVTACLLYRRARSGCE